MGHILPAELAELVEIDRSAFAERLGTHPWFEETLVPFVPLLQADPELAAATRARVPNQAKPIFDTWLARRVLPLRRLDLDEFCRLASAVVRERDAEFPLLEPLAPITSSWFCCCQRRADARVDGRGWTLEIEERDVGPAEVIHEEEWQATAHGDGWVIVVRLWSSSADVRVWVDPRAPTAPTSH